MCGDEMHTWIWPIMAALPCTTKGKFSSHITTYLDMSTRAITPRVRSGALADDLDIDSKRECCCCPVLHETHSLGIVDNIPSEREGENSAAALSSSAYAYIFEAPLSSMYAADDDWAFLASAASWLSISQTFPALYFSRFTERQPSQYDLPLPLATPPSPVSPISPYDFYIESLGYEATRGTLRASEPSTPHSHLIFHCRQIYH